MLFSGCGSVPRTTGPVSVGNGEYLIARAAWGFDTTGAAVKVAAIKEANEYCESQNATIEIIDSSQKDMVPFRSDSPAELRFRCLKP